MTTKPTESPAEIAERLLPCIEDSYCLYCQDGSGNHAVRCFAQYRPAIAAALQAERERADKADKINDNDLERVVHYRNLALELGAKPEHMLNKFDRDLAKRWGKGQGYDAKEELRDVELLWDENERLETQLATERERVILGISATRREEGCNAGCSYCPTPDGWRFVHDARCKAQKSSERERALSEAAQYLEKFYSYMEIAEEIRALAQKGGG